MKLGQTRVVYCPPHVQLFGVIPSSTYLKVRVVLLNPDAFQLRTQSQKLAKATRVTGIDAQLFFVSQLLSMQAKEKR